MRKVKIFFRVHLCIYFWNLTINCSSICLFNAKILIFGLYFNINACFVDILDLFFWKLRFFSKTETKFHETEPKLCETEPKFSKTERNFAKTGNYNFFLWTAHRKLPKKKPDNPKTPKEPKMIFGENVPFSFWNMPMMIWNGYSWL